MARTIEQIISSSPKNVQDYLAKMKAQGPLAWKEETYYSRVRIAPNTIAADGSNNTTYTFNAGTQYNAFQYGIGGSMVGAGFDPSLTSFAAATLSDTNLQKASGRETNDGAAFLIEAVSFHLEPTSDAEMVRRVFPELNVTCGFGSNLTTYKLGKPSFLPGGGGLFGGGPTQGRAPNLQDTWAPVNFASNGMPIQGNRRDLEDKILWKPNPDSEALFGMVITLGRAVSFIAPGRAAAAGVAAIIPPATVGAMNTFIEFTIKLAGPSFTLRPTNG